MISKNLNISKISSNVLFLLHCFEVHGACVYCFYRLINRKRTFAKMPTQKSENTVYSICIRLHLVAIELQLTRNNSYAVESVRGAEIRRSATLIIYLWPLSA